MKKLSLLTLLALVGLSQPALGDNTLKVESSFDRPNDSSEIKVNNTVEYKLDDYTKQSLTVGISKYLQEGKDSISVYPIYLETEWGDSVNLGVGYSFIEGQDGKFSASGSFSQPLGNSSKTTLSLNYLPMFDSQTTIKNGLTRTNLGTRVSWDISNKDRVSAAYQYSFLSDDNRAQEAELRYDRRLSTNVYVAAVGSYKHTDNVGVGYWSPDNRLAIGSELGFNIPVSKSTSCSLVGRASLVSEGDRVNSNEGVRESDAEARGGCQFNLDENNTLKLSAGRGYGTSVSAEYSVKF